MIVIMVASPTVKVDISQVRSSFQNQKQQQQQQQQQQLGEEEDNRTKDELDNTHSNATGELQL